MGRVRIIPVLLLDKGGLYKTVRFEKPSYVGDPINTVKIFNDKEADELVVLDFRATMEQRRPDFEKITEIAGEAFMPMAYGGGIRNLEDAKHVFDCGYEKVVLNSVLYEDLSLAESIASIYGSQSVVASIDVRKTGSDEPVVLPSPVPVILVIVRRNGRAHWKIMESERSCCIRSARMEPGRVMISP